MHEHEPPRGGLRQAGGERHGTSGSVRKLDRLFSDDQSFPTLDGFIGGGGKVHGDDDAFERLRRAHRRAAYTAATAAGGDNRRRAPTLRTPPAKLGRPRGRVVMTQPWRCSWMTWSLVLVPISGFIAAACVVDDTDLATVEDELVFVSSTIHEHEHELVLDADDIEFPPETGLELTTRPADGHTHTLFLSGAELDDLREARPARAVTSREEGHEHAFELALFEVEQDPPP